MAKPTPDLEGFSGPVFRRRLVYYLVGLGIGLVMLGLLQQMKRQAAQSRQQQQQQQPPTP